jgi:hypothetical protein
MRYTRLLLALCASAFCAPPSPASESTTYAYDARGRLMQVAHSGTVNNGVGSSYCYDKSDNRTNVTVTTSGGGSTPTFSINSGLATEGGAVVFTVSKCPIASGTLTVSYATSGGTAGSGTDFTATSGTLSFLAAETAKTISVPTTDDASVEGTENFTVTLSNASVGSTIGTATGTGTIKDND